MTLDPSAIPPSHSSLPPLHFINDANLVLLAPTKDGSGRGNNGRYILERVCKAEMLVCEDSAPMIERLAARAKVVRMLSFERSFVN
jgi:hypothetical protein